jgi:hypothetical protein
LSNIVRLSLPCDVFEGAVKELKYSTALQILQEKSSLDFDSCLFVKFLYNYLL